MASRRTVAIVTLFGVAATSFPITVLSASLPVVAADLNTSDTAAAWVIAAPLLAVAVFTPAAGKLGDLHGHRKMFIIGFAVSGLLHFGTAASTNIVMLVMFRTLSAAAAAPTGPAALSILMRVFPEEQRNQAMGWWGAVVAASPALGVVIGGPAVDWLGWPVLFVAQGALALSAVALAWPILPVSGEHKAVKFDIPGAITLGLGIAAVLVAINRGPTWGWDSPRVIGGLIASPILLFIFWKIEQRAAQPLLPPEILHKPAVVALFFSQTMNQAAYMGGFVISPFLLARVFGFGTAVTSLIMVGRPLAFSLSAGWAGRVADRLPAARTAATSILVIAGALLATGFGAKAESLVLIVVAMIATGLGMGFGRPIVMTAMANSVADGDHGVASGTFQMMIMLGSAIGISSLSTVIGESESPDRFLGAFSIAALVSVAAATMTWWALHRISTRPRDEAVAAS